MKDLYRFEHDSELYEITGESQYTMFMDGSPFTFPIVNLKSTDGKLRSCPRSSLDQLTKRVPWKVVEVDCYEKFLEYFELATEGKYTKHIKSYSSTDYVDFKTSLKKMVENYSSGFQGRNLSDESKTLLESFAMMLLLTVEMASVEKKKKGKA